MSMKEINRGISNRTLARYGIILAKVVMEGVSEKGMIKLSPKG